MSGEAPAANECTVRCTLNGRAAELRAHPMGRLLDALRGAGCTGVKEGCGEGECGACAVLVDGELWNSCLVPLLQVEGRAITTVEGLASGPDGEVLHAVQQAFIAEGGAQCGICTPGMVIAAVALLARRPQPTVDEIREGIAGNLCRCTGYTKIVAAIEAAARATST